MFFKFARTTLSSLFKKPITLKYPFETKTPPQGLKGHVENNVGQCICCGICEKKCPSQAISVDRAERTWSINRFRCIQCGTCVRECPRKCLNMDPAYPAPADKKSIFCVHIPEKKKDE